MKNIIPIKPLFKRKPKATDAVERGSSRIIAVTSGKGGVGKTNVTCNLGISLAQRGQRVCIFDADTSLANMNILMGMAPNYTIEHLLNGECSIDGIMLEGPAGVRIIPSASGIAKYASLDAEQRGRLLDALESLEDRFDYILIDTAAGIGDSVIEFIQSAQYAIVVISTEPTSLTDAFAMLGALKRSGYDRPVHVLVNMVMNYATSMEVFKRFEAAVRKYLKVTVRYLGYISDDEHVKKAVSAQRPVVLHHPEAHASRCFATLAEVIGKQLPAPPLHSMSSYWRGMTPKAPPKPEGEAPEEVTTSGGSETGPVVPDKGLELASVVASVDELLRSGSVSLADARRAILDLHEDFEDAYGEPLIDESQWLQLTDKWLQLTEDALARGGEHAQRLASSFEAAVKRRYGHEPVDEKRLIAARIQSLALPKSLRRALLDLCDTTDHQAQIQRLATLFDEMLSGSDLTDDELRTLVDRAAAAYRDRFGLPHAEADAGLIVQLRQMTARLEAQQAQIDRALDELAEAVRSEPGALEEEDLMLPEITYPRRTASDYEPSTD